MYLTVTDQHWGCDIEADNLLEEATLIWCVCLINCVTREKHTFTDQIGFNTWQAENPEALYVGHNFLAYDAPMLNKLWQAKIKVSRIVDTFVLSQLFHPNLPRPQGLHGKKGPHSLEAWGLRLRYGKTGHSDFSVCTPEMLRYCMNDTILVAYLFIKLSERMRSVGFSEEGCEIEHLAWNIIQNKQRRNGFPIDRKRALELYTTLRAREEELKNEIYTLWPPVLRTVATFAKARKADGTPTANFTRHSGQYPEIRILDDGRYEAIDWVSFDLGSPQQRVAKLLELGWEPTSWNINKKTREKTSPKVDEDSLTAYAELSGRSEVKALAKWIVINSRANMIGTWLDASEKDGKIHGKLFIASTLRYKHSEPNSANIPAVRLDKEDHPLYGEAGLYTYESRDLWTSGGDEWALVGIDAKGIQLRVLANYINDPEFTKAILSADPHSENQKRLGLPSRALTKTITYAILMGAGDARISSEAKVSLKEAKAAKKKFFDQVPGLRILIDRLQSELDKTGRIKLCDGTPIIVPSPHMVIPYLLQGDESRIMKRSIIYVDDMIRIERLGKDVLKVADIHDEWQFRARKSVAQHFVDKALPCFVRAGESFDYLIKIEGDAKIGNTWAETH